METNDMIRNEEIKGKLEFYNSNSISVHITLHSKTWFNGLIVSIDQEKVIINEEKLGLHPIYFNEIKDVVKRLRE